MTKKLAIIGASYLQLPLIQKAKSLGYETHVFAWKANDPGEREADFFYPVSIVEKEKITEICRQTGIDGICSIASDLAMLTVNYAADQLHLPANSLECTRKSTNKHEMRQALEAAGIRQPKSRLVCSKDKVLLEQAQYPQIIKPTDRSGSRGIQLVYNPRQAEEAVLRAMEESFEKKVLMEDFLEGDEYSVEYISQNGKHYYLQATQKFTTGAPAFIETGHREPANLSDTVLSKICKLIPKALDALGITTGASHSEIKVDENGNIGIIEIGARMGGDAIGSHLVQYSTGYDFVKMVIDAALGQPLDFSKTNEPSAVESRFILTKEDDEAFVHLQKHHPEKILDVLDYHPENLNHCTDSSNRAGCFIVKAN